MRLLFELLLFVVLVFFFGAMMLIFYKWLAKRYLKSGNISSTDPNPSNAQSNETKGGKDDHDR